MIEISKEFRDLRSGFGSSFSSQLERLDWSRIDLDFSLREGESNGRDFQWVNCALIFRINILKLLLQSEQNLIRALTGKADRAEFVDPPTSKCFPVVQSVMVGDLRTNVNGLDIILLDLASILQPHGITLYCPSSFEAPIDDHPNIKFIGTSQEQSLWLQDSHFIHEGGNRYPCLRIDEPRYSTCILEERRWRMFSEGGAVEEAASDLRSLVDSSPFGVMGSVGDEHAQFSFLEAMMTMDLRAAHQAILFTYNEGGNCLIGEFEGKRYAIIGKDVLGLNKKLMAERLSKIGLNKNSDGNWVVGPPYDEMDCRIDDDDIKLLVSLDMGLESPELCFFVEQPVVTPIKTS